MLRAPAESGDVKLLDKLLSRLEKRGKKELEAELNATDFYGFTPLHWASWNGHISCVFSLIEHGANLNTKTKFGGQSPLMCAARHGHLDCVALLLEYGADPLAKDNDGRTAAKLSSGEARDAILLLLERESAREKERLIKGVDARTENAHRQLHMHDSLLDKGKLLMKKTISHFHPSHSHATSAATTTTTSTNNNTTTITNNNSTTVTATTNTSATELDEFGDITRSSLSVGYSSNSLSDFGDITDTTRRSGKDSSDSPEGEEEHEEETLSAYPTSYKSKFKSRLTNLANHYHKDAEIAELRSQLESKTQELTLLKQEFAKFKKDKELEISSLLLTIDKLRVQNDSELASYTASPVASSTTEASQSPLKKVEPELESEPESKKLGSDSGKETLVHDISSNSLNSFTSASFV